MVFELLCPQIRITPAHPDLLRELLGNGPHTMTDDHGSEVVAHLVREVGVDRPGLANAQTRGV